MMKLRQRPKRTIFSRVEAPLGTVRERDAGNGQLVRMIKIRMDGQSGKRWIPYARWWWEQNNGQVPKGKRVCHADGVLLNDDPSNLVLLTPGEVFNLYHKLDPDMSARNRAACGRSAARRNVEAGRIHRETCWLPTYWYGVDFHRRLIHNRPKRKRWMIYADHRLLERMATLIAERVRQARVGDTSAARLVITQAGRLQQSWRWARSLSLGWPHVNLMTACVFAALTDHGPLTTSNVIATVGDMRRLFDWRPHPLHRGVLFSIVSQVGSEWILSTRAGRRESTLSIGDAARLARMDGDRIVPIRGRDLDRECFNGFTRVNETKGKAVPA